jgi:hypothetical protein
LIGFYEGDLVLEKNHHWLLQFLAQTIGALANKEIPFFPSSSTHESSARRICRGPWCRV